jgi:hypothetical protein
MFRAMEEIYLKIYRSTRIPSADGSRGATHVEGHRRKPADLDAVRTRA